MTKIYSYVVRYDSGFAPNPFYGYCTLATCKPEIRGRARVGDWVVGCGSRSVGRGGYLVYAMKLIEALTFDQYDGDSRFKSKKPFRNGSRKQSCGDNIYYRFQGQQDWNQRDSFHSYPNGYPNFDHINRDTGINRVLISNEFVYFGGEGPVIPDTLRDGSGRFLCASGRGYRCFEDQRLTEVFENWIWGLGVQGYQGVPLEWLMLRGPIHA